MPWLPCDTSSSVRLVPLVWLCRTVPFGANQMTCGAGLPSTSHLSRVSLPSSTVTFLPGNALGGTGNMQSNGPINLTHCQCPELYLRYLLPSPTELSSATSTTRRRCRRAGVSDGFVPYLRHHPPPTHIIQMSVTPIRTPVHSRILHLYRNAEELNEFELESKKKKLTLHVEGSAFGVRCQLICSFAHVRATVASCHVVQRQVGVTSPVL